MSTGSGPDSYAWIFPTGLPSNAYWWNQIQLDLWGASGERMRGTHALWWCSVSASKATVTCLPGEYNYTGDKQLKTLAQLPSSTSALAHGRAGYFFSPGLWSVSPSQDEGIMKYFQVLWTGQTVFIQLHANKLTWWLCWALMVLGQEITVSFHISLQIGLHLIWKESQFGITPFMHGGLATNEGVWKGVLMWILFPPERCIWGWGAAPENATNCVQVVCMLSRVLLFVTLWTVTHQAPLSAGFPRQEYWSGLPFSPLGDLPNPGFKPSSPALQAGSLPPSHQGRQQHK